MGGWDAYMRQMYDELYDTSGSMFYDYDLPGISTPRYLGISCRYMDGNLMDAEETFHINLFFGLPLYILEYPMLSITAAYSCNNQAPIIPEYIRVDCEYSPGYGFRTPEACHNMSRDKFGNSIFPYPSYS